MQVVSFAGARARRERSRERELQEAFRAHGYTFVPLDASSWDLQDQLGCRRGVSTLAEAEGLLQHLERSQ